MKRRKFLSVTAGVVAAGVVGAALPKRARARQATAGAALAPGTTTIASGTGAVAITPEVAAFLGDIQVGTSFGRWTIAGVHGVKFGAIPFVLEAGGTRYQVDVLRREPAGPLGVGNTKRLSLFVANKGDGRSATREEQGLGAMALATLLAEREQAGVQVPQLLTLRERQARHPDGLYGVPL